MSSKVLQDLELESGARIRNLLAPLNVDEPVRLLDLNARPRVLASRDTPLTVNVTGETSVISVALPAPSFAVGTVVDFDVLGIATISATAGTSTFRLRVGAATLTGTIVASNAPANVASKANFPFSVKGRLVCRSIGPTGTVFGVLLPLGPTIAAAGAVSGVTAAQTVDTTQSRLIELTFQLSSASNPYTVHAATIMLTKP